MNPRNLLTAPLIGYLFCMLLVVANVAVYALGHHHHWWNLASATGCLFSAAYHARDWLRAPAVRRLGGRS